jgi:cell division protein FtsB
VTRKSAGRPGLEGPEEREGREGRPVRSVTVAAVLFLVVLLGTVGAQSWKDLERARDRQAELTEKIEESEARIESLDRRIRRLRNDPLLVERLAREDLGLAREGDVIFVLPEEPEGVRRSPLPTPSSEEKTNAPEPEPPASEPLDAEE